MGTVVPGFDDSKLQPGSVISRNGGNLSFDVDANLASNPDWVMVTTWNDYGENTHIESSTNYGTDYLDLTRNMQPGLLPKSSFRPSLSLTQQQAYWASYADYYYLGNLTVDFQIANSGPGDVNDLRITQVTGGTDATAVTPLPIELGTVTEGGNVDLQLKWNISRCHGLPGKRGLRFGH